MNYYSFNDIKFFNLEKKKILELDINFNVNTIRFEINLSNNLYPIGRGLSLIGTNLNETGHRE